MYTYLIEPRQFAMTWSSIDKRDPSSLDLEGAD